jgi:hypothetical protein
VNVKYISKYTGEVYKYAHSKDEIRFKVVNHNNIFQKRESQLCSGGFDTAKEAMDAVDAFLLEESKLDDTHEWLFCEGMESLYGDEYTLEPDQLTSMAKK